MTRMRFAMSFLGCLLVPGVSSAQDAAWPDLAGAPSVGGGGQDAAVVVGIERYAFVPPVPGARRNTDAWHAWLTDGRKVPVDRVALLRDSDATVEAMREAAARAAAQAGPDGTLWFVFVGHGAPREDGKDGLLIGVDAQQKAKSLVARSLGRGELLEALAKTRAGQVRVVLDACFSGKAPGGQPIVEGLQPLVVTASASADRRFAVLTAARNDQFAGPLPGAGRPAFSYLVLGALRGWGDEDGDGNVTAGEVTRYADRALRALVRDRDQTPTLLGDDRAPLARSGRERGPDLAALARKPTGAGLSFEVTALPSVPTVQRVTAFDGTTAGLDLNNVDVDALERYDQVVNLDKSDVPPERKAAAWRDLARSAPGFRDKALKRAGEWDAFLAQQRAAEEARKARAAARDRDWSRLSRLLPLGVVPRADKEKWARVFVDAYGATWDDNPYLADLAAFLPKGAIRGLVEGYVPIPAGTFTMGSPGSESGRDGDEAQHRVRITVPFLLKATEVTQGEWRELMGNNPSSFKNCGDDCPVENVSWWDAIAYVNALSKREGLAPCYDLSGCGGTPGGGNFQCSGVTFRGLSCPGFRLPTEAEWEYAARAGTDTALYTGPLTIRGANSGPELDPIAWYGGNSGASYPGTVDCSGWSEKQNPSATCGSHPVGKKRPNRWGLYDMLGNVWEWVWDWKGDYPGGEVADPMGPSSGSRRVNRGGGWRDNARGVRAAYRSGYSPGGRRDYLGFRPSRSLAR